MSASHPTHPERSTSAPARVYRLVRLCVHLIHGCFYVGVLFPFLNSRLRFRAIRLWSKKLLRILHVRYTVRGHLPAGTPTLIVSNHVSWLDIWVINSVIGVRFVAKSDIRRWPIVGFLVKGAGTIFIERDKRHDTARTNRSIVRALTHAEYVAIFPEGTRVAHGARPPLQSGFAGLYKLLGLPVVPVAVNSGPLYHRLWKRPGTITLHFGEPIEPGLPREEIEARVHAAINVLNT